MRIPTTARQVSARRLRLRTLRSTFAVGFLIATLLAVGNVLIVQSLLRQSDNVAATINIAGKMRMLSQRMGLMQLAMRDSEATAAFDTHVVYRAHEADFERAAQVLRYGGTAFGLTTPAIPAELHVHLDKLEHAWVTYKGILAQMRMAISADWAGSGGLEAEMAVSMLAASEALLNACEDLINALVYDTAHMQDAVMREIYALFGANMLVLLLAWAIIRSKVLKPIRRLMHISQALSAGDYSCRLTLDSDDEFGALGRVLNRSAEHIGHLMTDLDAKHASLKQAQVKLQRAAQVYQHISDGIVITDVDGYVQDLNPAFTAITGYAPEDVIGRRMNQLGSERHPIEFFRALRMQLERTGRWKGDIWSRHKSGREFICHLIVSTCYNEDGSVNCRIGLISDVTEKRKQEALIWEQAHFDHLTRLPNRQMFHENLQASIRQAECNAEAFALLFLDLDLFKEVNDIFGHNEGDLLLQQVATRLEECCGHLGVVARLGGDEFTVIAPGLENGERVHSLCQRVLHAVSQPYALTATEARISCSIGVAFYPGDTRSATDLLKYADLAMYAAKDKGRNQYCLFSSTMHDSVRTRHDLLRELQLAIDDGQIVLHYQPIVDLHTGCVAKAEALVRWQHPDHGLITPGDFIALAESSGLIVPLGEHVFMQAAHQVAAWRHQTGRELAVSVNVSPAQFQSEGLNSTALLSTLRELNLPGAAVTIEITERLLMESTEQTSRKLQEFRDAGIHIALDDFGTGYSSLSYLKRFDIDLLKIDKSFVDDLTGNSQNRALCEAIITMSHELGMKVVAEGIESQEQHDWLRAAGCDYGQGYFYSRAVEAGAFMRWLCARDDTQHSTGLPEHCGARRHGALV